MKKRNYIYGIFIVLFFTTMFLNNPLKTYSVREPYVMQMLKSSPSYDRNDYTEFVGPPISLDGGYKYFRIWIDETHANYTWQNATDYGWCTGSGTYADPYVIENFYIDAEAIGGGICIYDSKTSYFIIRNCWVENTEDDEFGAGVFMRRTENGLITDNIFTKVEDGVFFEFSCYNITVSNNIMVTDNRAGSRGVVCGRDVYNSTIYNNAMLNFYHGIGFNRDADLIIKRNFIENLLRLDYVGGSPLHLEFCNDSRITYNVLAGVFAKGVIRVYEENCDGNVIVNNIQTTDQSLAFNFTGISISSSGSPVMSSNEEGGLTFISSNNNYIANNMFLVDSIDGESGGIPSYDLFIILGTVSITSILVIFLKNRKRHWG